MCQQFPKLFFSSQVWQIFVCNKQGFFDKIFLFIFCRQNFAKFFQRENIGRLCYQWNKLKTILKSNILEHLTYNQNIKLRKLRNLRMGHFWGQRKVSMVRVWFPKERKFHIFKCKTEGLGPTFPFQSKGASIT